MRGMPVKYYTAKEKTRDRLFKWLAVCAAGMVIFQMAIFPTGSVELDYVVDVEKRHVVLVVLLTVGALLCIRGMDVLLWR